jgi:CubicO group peptidase (beta-lactamase class C family)
MRLSLASALWALAALRPATALPSQSDIQKRGLPVWDYYVDVDTNGHQTKFNFYSSNGYRMVSLNAYGGSAATRYAAVWVQRSGPGYFAIHNANAQQYQAWFNQYSAQGYVSTIVTATGNPGSEVYAGVMEKISPGPWFQRCGISATDFQNANNGAFANRQLLKSFDEYGSASNRVYCGVWITDPGVDKSTLYTGLSAAAYQTVFNSETNKPYWRPTVLSVSDDITYAALFTDTSVGTSWYARHGLAAADLATEVANEKNAGRYIVNLAAGGSGANARFAALWAAQDVPSARTWRVNGGAATGFNNNAAATTKADSLIQTFMQAAGVRQVQLSVGRAGNLLLNRAYTWSEPERSTTGTDDRFLMASLSKAFVEAAVQTLFNNNKLTPSTAVFPLLGYKCTTGDTRRCAITVQQLLDHTSGYENGALGFDPTYFMREIALKQSNGQHPATKKEVIDYVFPYPLATNPGATYSYLNFGYLVLSYLVEQVTGQPYFTYLQQSILTPEALNVNWWPADPAAHASDPVIQESMFTGLSAREPLNPNNVADIYGGDDMFKDSAQGSCAITASAPALVKFISKHGETPRYQSRLTVAAVWGNGGRAPGSDRSGSTPGASTWIESRWDGLDWALTINTRDFPGGEADFNTVQQGIDACLNTNP